MCSVSADAPAGFSRSNPRKGTTKYPRVPCEWCGKPIVARPIGATWRGELRKFCDNRCKYEAAKKRYTCQQCGVKFYRANGSHGGDTHKYCTRDCYFAVKAKRRIQGEAAAEAVRLDKEADRKIKRAMADAAKEVKLLARVCRDCQSPIGHMGMNCKVCEQCRAAAMGPQPHHKCRVDCNRCGEAFDTLKRKPAKMCKRCVKQMRKRLGSHRSRCRKRNLPYDSSISIKSLWELGNACYWCTKQCTRHRDHGDWEDSPTIDHIVPLMHPDNIKHGHTSSNCVLSCAACNSAKQSALDYNAASSKNPLDYMNKRGRKGAFMRTWSTVEPLREGKQMCLTLTTPYARHPT